MMISPWMSRLWELEGAWGKMGGWRLMHMHMRISENGAMDKSKVPSSHYWAQADVSTGFANGVKERGWHV